MRVLAASTEIGQGTNTIFSQIAAEALGIDPADVDIAQPDTAVRPRQAARNRWRRAPAWSSANSWRRRRSACATPSSTPGSCTRCTPAPSSAPRAVAAYVEVFGSLSASRPASTAASRRGWCGTTRTYLGDAYGTYGWAVYVAEVSVDTTTWETRVDDFVAVQEVGKVINPTLATGQIEGGVAQGIGWALYEDVVWRDGRMANSQMTNYIMPTSMDLPDIRVYFEEVPYRYGPSGAKGIGELPMDGPAPAIANAIAAATGANPARLPITPERLMELMDPASAVLSASAVPSTSPVASAVPSTDPVASAFRRNKIP